MANLKLFVFDIDNTITHGSSVWDNMHKTCGTWESHGQKFLKMFKNKEIDFDRFAELDALSWQEQKTDKLITAFKKTKLIAGFKELIEYLKNRQIQTAIISCSIGQFANYLQDLYSFDHIYANHLEINDHHLTGKINLRVTGNGKAKALEDLLKKTGIKRWQTAAVGDSESDLPLLHKAGASFIMRNQNLKEQADHLVNDFFEIRDLLKRGSLGQQ